MNLDRRTLLKATGATAAASMTGLAGCQETIGLDGNGLPDYERWLAATDDGDVEFAYLDWAALEALEDLEDDDDEEDEPEDIDDFVDEEDLLLAAPLIGATFTVIGIGFGLWGTGLNGIVNTDDAAEGPTAADFETSIEELLVVNDGFVLAGDVDVAEVDEALTDVPEDDLMTTAYEQTDEYEGYDIYEPVEDDDGFGMATDDAIAVDDGAIVFADDTGGADPVEAIQSVLAVAAGEEDGAADDLEEFEWLLETAGHGQVVFGSYGNPGDEGDLEEPADDEFEDARGMVSSLGIEADGSANAEFAATFESLDDETEAELEGVLGTSTDEVEFEVDDDRVTVSASWDENVLE